MFIGRFYLLLFLSGIHSRLAVLQEQFALVFLIGETGSVLLTEFRLAAEEEFEFHIVHTPLLILVFSQLG